MLFDLLLITAPYPGCNLSQVSKLETIQNKCMRLIIGAPHWTRLPNLLEESHLVPLQTHIQQMEAGLVSVIVSRHDNGPHTKSPRNIIPPPQAQVPSPTLK